MITCTDFVEVNFSGTDITGTSVCIQLARKKFSLRRYWTV